ncbi:hypothetical protein Aph01nite_67970 [Acrocarpospora phusangensis]|uniref:Uncharacterized protein n=1 Tax=Acrocarpospora phusangensis TaxID=1070424 RepID=A0A919URW3_9ACTN|nr:hypothetical protein [Acrocarpospora phusangensis]GIH28487.1 hypothetical protein Aph01nite_67970 [Acrocarpospora phusangensis]
MLTEQAHDALSALYARARKTSDNYELERIERALDEIIRLNDAAPAAFQIRSALAHAGQVLRERRGLASFAPLDDIEPHQEPGRCDVRFAVVDLTVWLQTTPALTEGQRHLMNQLLAEEDGTVLAATHGLVPARLRERISRIRRIARTAYASEVAAA